MTDAALRIERAFASEERARQWTITVARTAAMVAVCILLLIVAPLSIFPYLAVISAIFSVLGWARYWLAGTHWRRDWHAYAFILVDFAFMTLAVTNENPFDEPNFPPQQFLRFENFVYLYILLASLAISFRPSHLIWGGFSGALCWGAHIAWLTTLPDTVLNTDDRQEMRELMTNPYFIDLGVQLQHIVVFLIVAVLLALSTEASLRLARRQVRSERRFANLSRYVASEQVEDLASRDDPFGAETERNAAILFTDIVGFSSLSEARPPREVIGVLRATHSLIEQSIFAHNGVLDKFIGDGAMATFGAAQPTGTEARDAVACALEILNRIDVWNAGRDDPPIRIVIGVHYGPVVVGDVGSERRMELSVIGDTVNVAARLEAMTRQIDASVAISGETYEAAGRPGGFQHLGPRAITGRAEAVEVWKA